MTSSMMSIFVLSADGRRGGLDAVSAVCHPELKLKIPVQVFCMSWCADFEFWVTQAMLHRASGLMNSGAKVPHAIHSAPSSPAQR